MPEEVASDVALSFSPEAVHLHYRHADDWEEVDHVRFDDPDLRAGLGRLRDHARDNAGDARPVRLIIPEDQLLYTRLDVDADAPLAMPGAIGRALEGLTPYRVEELAFDWLPAGPGAVHVAVVSRQTLAEAEEFAAGNGFDVAGFIAVPDSERFPGEPDFTDSALDEDADDEALAAPPIDQAKLAHSLDQLRALTAARAEATDNAPDSVSDSDDIAENGAEIPALADEAQGSVEKPADPGPISPAPALSQASDVARTADNSEAAEAADETLDLPADDNTIAATTPEVAAMPLAPIISRIPASIPYPAAPAMTQASPAPARLAEVEASETPDRQAEADPAPTVVNGPSQPALAAADGAIAARTAEADAGRRRLAAPPSDAQPEPAITRHAGRGENVLIRHVPPVIRALFTGPHGALFSLLALLLVGMLAIALFSGQGNRAGDDPAVLAQDMADEVPEDTAEVGAADTPAETEVSPEFDTAADTEDMTTALAETQPEGDPVPGTAEAEANTADEAITAATDIGDDVMTAPVEATDTDDPTLTPGTPAEAEPVDIPAALAGLSPVQRPDPAAETAQADLPEPASADQVQADADDALGNALRQALGGGEAMEADDPAARIAMINPVPTSMPPADDAPTAAAGQDNAPATSAAADPAADPGDRATPALQQPAQTAPASQRTAPANEPATTTGLSQARRPGAKPSRPTAAAPANTGQTPQASANAAVPPPPSRPAATAPTPPAAEATQARTASPAPASRPASRPATTQTQTAPAATQTAPPVATASGQGRLQRSTRPPSRPMRSGAAGRGGQWGQPPQTRLADQGLTPPVTDRAAFFIPVDVIRVTLPILDDAAPRYAQARPIRRPGTAAGNGGADGQATRHDVAPADAPPPVRPAAAASTAASAVNNAPASPAPDRVAAAPAASTQSSAPGMRPARKPGNAGVDSAAVQEAVTAAIAANEGAGATAPAGTTGGLRSSMAPPQRSAAFVANTAARPDAAAAAAAASIQSPAVAPAPAPAAQPAPPAGNAAADAAAEQSRLEAELQAQAEARIRARADADTQAEARARAEAEARARAAAEAEERAARARGGSYRPAEVDNEPELIAAATGSASQVAAQNATIAGALNPRRTTLIGVVGAGKTSRGLIRLRNGKVVTVRVGDRIDGGPITAIGDGAVTYTVGGRARQLKILDGR